MRFKTRQVSFRDQPAIKQLRETVFIEEQGVPVDLEWDGKDEQAIHVIATDDKDYVIGTARLLANGHIGRMAVLKPWRHHGVGTALLETLLTIAKDNHLRDVFLHAQTTAVGFYQRFGFQTRGEEFMDAGIPHYLMEKKLGVCEKERIKRKGR